MRDNNSPPLLLFLINGVDKMSKKYCVYCHTNIINDKKYIGITSKSMKQRVGKNGNGYKKCPIFSKAISKYGWSNFRTDILFENLTKEQACQLEIEMIKKYDTTNILHGYNFSTGGGGANGVVDSIETRIKKSKSHKGIIKDEEWRKKLS